MSIADVYALLRGSTDEHKCVVSDHLSSSPGPVATHAQITCCNQVEIEWYALGIMRISLQVRWAGVVATRVLF